jgi:predicted GIY-YIG superfamily endonuclease
MPRQGPSPTNVGFGLASQLISQTILDICIKSGEGCRAVASAEADVIKYVYILQSINYPERHYTGRTDDLDKRIEKHNAGLVSHTAKFAPWRLQTHIGFSDPLRAVEFEKYLKSGSGRAFAKKRL